MSTLWKVASLSVVATAISGCFVEKRTEVVRQPVVQEQPVIERHVAVPAAPQAQQPVIERERVVVIEPPAPRAEQIPPPPAPAGEKAPEPKTETSPSAPSAQQPQAPRPDQVARFIQ